jgi:nucleotide-binding universal stress UspA family protein
MEDTDPPGQGLTALIPLDGTELSESALSVLPLLLSLGFEKIKLVSVWDYVWADEQLGRGHTELKEVAERGRTYLGAYLKKQAERVKGLGLGVETVVRTGRAAEEALRLAAEDSVDLILIATHGRDGMTRWRLGSVADKIVRQAPCPTLVIGPNVVLELAPFYLRRILVPLDGSPLAEEALAIAIWVAGRTGAELELVRAVTAPPIDAAMGANPVGLLAAIEDTARVYLAGKAEGIKGKTEAHTALVIGSAPEMLAAYAREKEVDLVIMASHARTSIARAVLGSVTDRMLHGPAPVLVLRPEEVRSGLVELAKAQRWQSHVHRVRHRTGVSDGRAES